MTGGSASSVSPARAFDDHAGSSAGARSSTPGGASHSSAGRAPCQRTANDSGPARSGSASTVSDWPSQSGGKPGRSSIASRTLAHEHGAQRRRGTGPGRVPASVARTAAHGIGRHGLAGGRGGAPASRGRPTPSAASSSKPQSSSAATTPGSPRDASRRSARAASTTSPIGGGNSACSPRSSWRSQPRATASASGRSRTSIGAEPRSASATSPSAARTHVRCGTGNSSASSIGAATAPRPGAVRASPASRRSRPWPAPRPTRRGGRDTTSTGAPSTRSTEPSTSTVPRRADPHDERDRERHRRAVLDLDDHDRAARRGRAVAPVHDLAAGHAHDGLDHRRRAGALLTRRRLLGGDVPAVVGADPPVEREVAGARPRRGRRRPRTRAVSERRPIRQPGHCMPWSSGLALRIMSSGMRSAGRAPS